MRHKLVCRIINAYLADCGLIRSRADERRLFKIGLLILSHLAAAYPAINLAQLNRVKIVYDKLDRNLPDWS